MVLIIIVVFIEYLIKELPEIDEFIFLLVDMAKGS